LQIKRLFLRFASARFALGVGVGAMLMGLLNLNRDPLLAAMLLIAGGGAIALGAAEYWRLNQTLEEP